MTIASALAKPAHRMEYILAIEGIGYPVDEFDLSQGFDGDVFVTADLDGTLASDLGCTVHGGLNLPSSVGDRFDSRTNYFEPGSSSFTVIDVDEVLLNTISPLKTTGRNGVLNAGLVFDATTVQIDNATTTWVEGDVIWLAGLEAVKLGAKALVGGTVYNYTGSTRGHLGTPRSRTDNRLTSLSGFAWEADTVIHDYGRYWHNNRCILYMHVPGDVVDNCERVYTGRLRGAKIESNGASWTFPAIDDMLGRNKRLRKGPVRNRASHQTFIRTFLNDSHDRWVGNVVGSPRTYSDAMPNSPSVLDLDQVPTARRKFRISPGKDDWGEYLAGAMAYAYRNRVPGGTAGMRSTAVSAPDTPQAYVDAAGRYRMDSFLLIDGNVVKALYKSTHSSDSWREIVTSVSSYKFGTDNRELFAENSEIRFLLSNDGNINTNRFALTTAGANANQYSRTTRNPVDVILMFLLSMDNEYLLDDATGASTSTVVTMNAGGMTVDQWIGYSLHSVEQSTTLGQARVISDNSATTITVDNPFVNAPTNGNQYQIRNSIYDVLPFGFGMGIHHAQVDIASFEAVRDKYLADANLGTFVIGLEDTLDIWGMIQNHICRPYGILIYTDRTSGKLTATYVGDTPVQDGLDGDYVAVNADQILDLGDISYIPRSPVKGVDLVVRNNDYKAIKPVSKHADSLVTYANHVYYNYTPPETSYKAIHVTTPGLGDKGATIKIRLNQLDTTLNDDGLDVITVPAMLNSEGDAEFLISKMFALLAKESKPPPELDILLDMSFIRTVQSGTTLSVTDTTRRNPINPYSGERGWSNLVCRVLSSSVVLDEINPGVQCRIQLLNSVIAGRIAPACDVSGKGSDGPVAYFTVHPPSSVTPDSADYHIDTDELDWGLFAVGDKIQLRDKTGAVVATESLETISAFGSNQSSTPSGASDGRIYIDGAITRGIVAGDYITLASWSASNTSNMDTFAAYADSGETLGAGNDDARKYT